MFEGARAKNSKFIHMGTITLVEFNVTRDRQLSESDKLQQREENLRSEIREHVLRVDSPHESWLTSSGALFAERTIDA